MRTPPRPIRVRPTDRRRTAILGLALASLAVPAAGSAQSPVITEPPRVAHLGSCRLANGTAIAGCRIAYRTFGQLNARRDNAVLVPTFFAGKSEDHGFMLGTYVDTLRYHVIIADALADGHSSSPSNARPEHRDALRHVTIGDMVDAHHRLLTQALGIDRLHAVVGISMGGFQAFEWAVRYPDVADAIVSVVGSPRPTSADRMVYRALISGADNGSRLAPGAPVDSAWEQMSRIEALFMRTPRALRELGIAKVEAEVRATADGYRRGWALEDYAAQMRAIERYDLAAEFGGDLSRAARVIRARLLVVYSPDDHMVSPEPAMELARLAGAATLRVPSSCGHAVFWCEERKIGTVVRRFLDGPRPDVTSR